MGFGAKVSFGLNYKDLPFFVGPACIVGTCRLRSPRHLAAGRFRESDFLLSDLSWGGLCFLFRRNGVCRVVRLIGIVPAYSLMGASATRKNARTLRDFLLNVNRIDDER